MPSDRELLNKDLEKFQPLVDATKSDSFKLIAEYVEETSKELEMSFTRDYHTLDDKRKRLVDDAAKFIGAFRNLQSVFENNVDYCKTQLDILDQEGK